MRRVAWIVQAVLALSLGVTASAQSYLYATGNTNFGVNIPIENGFINVANGNVHLEISLANQPQRGNLHLDESLVYDSRIWMIGQYSHYYWWPTNVPNSSAGWRLVQGNETGTVQLNITGLGGQTQCDAYGDMLTTSFYSMSWTDPSGTVHPFNVLWDEATGPCGTPPQNEIINGAATDSSGYSVTLSGPNNTSPQVAIFDNHGTQVYPQVIDRFGNYWSSDANGNLVDDLNRTPVLTSTNGNLTYYDVLTEGGGRARYTATMTSINVQTAFDENDVTEWSGTLTAIQSIQLPDGSSYSFSYDSYGEMTSMTLPTGGVVDLVYSNYQDSYQNENRWLTFYSGGHGSLTFAPSVVTQCSGTQETGCVEQMKVTDASQNDTVYTLTLNDGAWNTTTSYYQGPMSGGHMLVSNATTYDFSNACPSGACVGSAFITKQTETTTLADVGLSRQTTYAINAYANQVNSMKQWDYYAGSPPSAPALDTEYTYTGYDLTQAQVLDGSGNQVSLTAYGFNTNATPSSAPSTGHNAGLGTNGPYLASVSQWINSTGQTLTTTFTNDDAGTQLTSTSPNGQTTSSYDSTDTYLTTLTPPTPSSGVSLPQSASYDPSTGLPLSTTDPNGAQTVYSGYDWAGRPGLISYPDGGAETLTYSPVQTGAFHTMNAGASAQTQTLFDGYGRTSRIAVANGQSGNPWYQTDDCYDANGRLQFQSYRYQGNGWGTPQVCSGSGDAYSYDALGRVTRITHGDGTSISYQYQGRAVQATDENGVSRVTQVDGLGRITAVCEISSNSSMPGSGSPASCGMDIPGTGFLTAYSYSLANHTTTVAQGVQTRVFQTDSLGRTIFVQEPELYVYNGASGYVQGVTTYSYAYNGTGLVVTRNRPQANQTISTVLTTTTTQYDSVGRVVNVSYSDGTPAKSFFYDVSAQWGQSQSNLKGRLSEATAPALNNWAGDIFSYDAMGRVIFTGQCFPYGCGNGGYDKYISASYDWNGNLTSESDPESGTINYGRSPAGEVTSITNANYNDTLNPGSLVSDIQNGPFGPMSYQLGNGLGITVTYDALGHVNGNYVCSGSTSVSCAGANAYLYGFWIARQGQQLTEVCDGFCNTLGYDEFNRLTSYNPTVNGPQSFSYSYDRYGNRWAQSAPQGGPSSGLSFNTANNEVNTAGYTYGAAGNLINDGNHSYSYDAEDNLISVDNGDTAQYVYDALNHRIQAQNANGANAFTFDYAGRRISTWLVSTDVGSEGRIYWGNQQIAFRSLDGSTYFDHQDWRGTERLRTDYAGNDAATFALYSFGDYSQAVESTGPYQDNTGYASLEYDMETATNHAQYRQYADLQGRWMSPDPYGGSYDMNNPQSFNRYSYVRNNPIAFNDPSGLVTCGDCQPDPPSSGCDLECGILTLGIGALIGGLEDLFGGGPSFHGSLKPRPSTPDWDGNFGESLGIPTSIPQGNWGLGMALGLPSEGCEFGPCGDVSNPFANATTAPIGWCAEHPTICGLGEDAADFFRAIPAAAASVTLLSMEGDNSPKPTDAECRVIVQNAKNTCTNKYPFAGALGNQLGAWRACVRQIVEPTGCDF